MTKIGVYVRIILIFITFIFISYCSAQEDTSEVSCKPCRQHPKVIGKGFIVHGALRYYNGTPSIRLWKIGTHRILGISEGLYYLKGYCNIPEWLETKLDWNIEIIGDFKVYPFDESKPGVMQYVCIDTAYNLKIVPLK